MRDIFSVHTLDHSGKSSNKFINPIASLWLIPMSAQYFPPGSLPDLAAEVDNCSNKISPDTLSTYQQLVNPLLR